MYDAKPPTCRRCLTPHPRACRVGRSTYLCFACLDLARADDRALNLFLCEVESHKTPEGRLARRLYAVDPYTDSELMAGVRGCPVPHMAAFREGLAEWVRMNGGREHSHVLADEIIAGCLKGSGWLTRWAWYLFGGWKTDRTTRAVAAK